MSGAAWARVARKHCLLLPYLGWKSACILAQTEKHIVYSARLRNIRRGLVYLRVVGMLQGGKCFPSDCHIQASQNVPPSFLAARDCCSLHKTQVQVNCKCCPICILRLLVVTLRSDL